MKPWLWPIAIAIAVHVALAVVPIGARSTAKPTPEPITLRLHAAATTPPAQPLPPKRQPLSRSGTETKGGGPAQPTVVPHPPASPTRNYAPATIHPSAEISDPRPQTEPSSIGTTPSPTANNLRPPPAPAPAFDENAFAATVRRVAEHHKRYPLRAVRLNQTGVAIVVVIIEHGKRARVALVKSSRSRLLDREAVRMVRAALKQLGREVLPDRKPGQPLRVELPINFRIRVTR